MGKLTNIVLDAISRKMQKLAEKESQSYTGIHERETSQIQRGVSQGDAPSYEAKAAGAALHNEIPATFTSEYRQAEARRFPTGVKQVNSLADAAHVMAPIRRNAVRSGIGAAGVAYTQDENGAQAIVVDDILKSIRKTVNEYESIKSGKGGQFSTESDRSFSDPLSNAQALVYDRLRSQKRAQGGQVRGATFERQVSGPNAHP